MSKNLSQPNNETLLAIILGLIMLAGVVVNGIVITQGFIAVYFQPAAVNTAGALDLNTVESALKEIGR